MSVPSPTGTMSGSAGRRGRLLLALLLSAATAQADPPHPGLGQPDIDDLRLYQACNRVAETQLLGFDEAAHCSRALLRIELAFVPGISPEDFDRLPLHQKSVVSIIGYLRYRDWSQANVAWLSALDMVQQRASAAVVD
jgi:hypothetical protein